MVKKAKAKTGQDGGGGGGGGGEIKRPLPRGPHTIQLVFHTAVHSLLVLLCAIVLPAHLVGKQMARLNDADGAEGDAAVTLFGSLATYFSLPSDTTNEATLRKATWGSLQALLVVQGWAALRFRKWYDLGAAIDTGDRNAAQTVTKEGWAKGAERLAITTLVSLPAAMPLLYAIVVVQGAPLLASIKDNLQLTLALTLTVALPLLHTLPSDMDQWTRVLGFGSTSQDTPEQSHSISKRKPATRRRERLLRYQAAVPLLAALISSAALTLDHGKAWQTWPIPPCLGLFLGTALADVVGTAHYLVASS